MEHGESSANISFNIQFYTWVVSKTTGYTTYHLKNKQQLQSNKEATETTVMEFQEGNRGNLKIEDHNIQTQ